MMIIDGSQVVQFLSGVVQLLGIEFSILAAYHIFSWQRAEALHIQLTESLNRSLNDFTKAVAVLTKNETILGIPLQLLQDEEQFETLVSSATESVDKKTGVTIEQLAESPRNYRRELHTIRYRSTGSSWLWFAMIISAIGCLLAVCGLLISNSSEVYSLCELNSPAPLDHRVVILITLLVLAASLFSILSILTGLFIQNRRTLHPMGRQNNSI